MRKTNARLFLAVCLAILVVACGHGKGIPPEGADHAEDHGLAEVAFQAGVDAYERGDYETALKEWRPLADQGYAGAQNELGAMYEEGKGVPQDYTEAVKWYRLAADQGVAPPQHNLGRMYATGRGVPQDYVQAHMWFSLSAARGNEDAPMLMDRAAKEMTPAQLAEAQRLAREWKAKGK